MAHVFSTFRKDALFQHFETAVSEMPRKAVPGSLGVALDLADKASASRPEELAVREEDFPRWDFLDGGCRYLGIYGT